MREFYDQVVGSDLVIRRCQVNLLHKGGFVGFHLDTDSNPDYTSPIVIQFSSEYSGGDYVVHHPVHSAQEFSMPRYSMIISSCNLPHEVTEVTSGRRKSLVYFLSHHAGKNRRWENGEVEDAMAKTSVAAVSSITTSVASPD
jgi:predicted 2-oxoglutarate/Fe(II)-dependent dioxygenase YbiX